MATPPRPTTLAGWAIWTWGVGGVLLLLGQATWRLTPKALEVLDGTLTTPQVVVTVVWTLFMVYSEAWRGFHKQFSPRVVVRALGIAADPVAWRVILAPVVAMGLLYGTRRRLIVSRVLLLGIIGLVVIVHQLPHPWRGIVDVGVVVGLFGGALSLAGFAIAAVLGRPPAVAAEFPEA